MECPKFNLFSFNKLLVDEKQCTVTLNNITYKNECVSFYESSLNKCLQEHYKNTKFNGYIEINYVGRKCYNSTKYENGKNTSSVWMSDSGQITFF